MFIKNLDYLSPRVTFYYKGFLSHSSIISGILSIIAIVFIVIFIVYFSLDLAKKKNPNVLYFNTFEKDSGIYELNTSSLFHFITVSTNIKGKLAYHKFNFSLFNVIGASSYVENFVSNKQRGGIHNFDHWLYGYCDKNNNTEELDDLLNSYSFLEESACIKKYYNKNKTKYYEIGESGFVWPSIEHGTFHEKNKLYGIYVQKCSNTITKELFGEDNYCSNEEGINKFFNIQGSNILNLYFLNNFIDVLDYAHPIKKYFYRIENPFDLYQYFTNDININPALIKDHVGLVLDKTQNTTSYMFDRNDVYINDIIKQKGNKTEDKNIFMAYCFFLKNNKVYYERTYKRIQEVISSIGGIYQAISIIAISLNYFYNNFIILSDTEMLLHSLIHIEKRNHRKKSIEYRNLHQKIKELQKLNKKEELKKSSEKRRVHSSENKNKIKTTRNKNEGEISKTNIDKSINNLKEKYNSFNNSFNIGNEKTTPNNLDNLEKLQYFNKSNQKDKTFLNFLYFSISCGKKKLFFKLYQDFRIKIISEEHLIRNHLNIYNLLKVTEMKRHTRRSSYHLEDLINLV